MGLRKGLEMREFVISIINATASGDGKKGTFQFSFEVSHHTHSRKVPKPKQAPPRKSRSLLEE